MILPCYLHIIYKFASFTDYKDEAGLRAECSRSRREGFTGKMAIHPAQVAVINECFSPGDEEIERARKVLKAFRLLGILWVVMRLWLLQRGIQI